MILSNSDDAAWWPVKVTIDDNCGLLVWPVVMVDYRVWNPL